jgi:glyoxylase-like metal-dependent hydrolase (beta-lactamase superfamily II)
MIDVEQHGSVRVFRLARAWFGRPLYWTAAYWVDGLLIDTGPACTASQLARLLADAPVRQIAITHAHEDHIGGLPLLRRQFPQAAVYASRQALPLLENPSLIEMQAYRRLIWGVPEPSPGVCSLDEVDDRIQTPEFMLRAIETPGHSRDHVSYYEPRYRWLFSGDAFIGGRDVAWAPEFDMFAIVSSLRTMASLRPERLVPGSGSIRRTPLPDLHGKISALIQLAQEVERLERSGCSTPEMVEMLFGGEPRIKFWTMGHFSAANLVEACRSYNAIVAPLDVERISPPPKPAPRRPGDFTDSSPKRSSDPDDVRR